MEICQHADQHQLTRRYAFDFDIESTHGQPCSCRARPVNVDDGLEDIRWICGLGGEKLPAASYALLQNLKKRLTFCHRRGIEKFGFVACFLRSSAQKCFYQTPGRRPPRITGRFVNTVTRGWVGAPNERAPPDFMAQSLVFSIDVCRGLGISPLRTNIWLSFSQADLGPRSAPELLGFFFFSSFKLFFQRFVLIASGTEIFWRVSLTFELFFGNIAFPLSPVLLVILILSMSIYVR